MKPSLLCLGLLSLLGAGCLTTTDGDNKAALASPPATELARPLPVKPSEVNESNARSALKRLENEVRFDERAHRTAVSESADKDDGE